MLKNTNDTEVEAIASVGRFCTKHSLIRVTGAYHLPLAMAWFTYLFVKALAASDSFNIKHVPAEKHWCRK